MATFFFYNHTIHDFNTGVFSVSDTYKVILLSDSAAFNGTDTTIDAATNTGGWEISGYGWDVGGLEITNPVIASDGADGSKFSGDDISQAISGGDLGPVYAYLIVNVTESKPVAFVLLSAPQTVLNNNLAIISWNAAGIIAWTPGN